MASIKTVLELANQQFMAALKQSENALKNFKTSAQDAGSKFGDSFNAMNIASTALGASLLLTARQAMALADDIGDIAAAHQDAISSVLGLAAALQANGGKAENVGRLYLELSKSIDQANGGNLKTAQSFQDLGVSISDLGNLAESEIRNKLIKGIADIQDPAERTARAFEMFGKAATGVDFVKLAADIDNQTAKYAAHEGALKTAGEAYDKLGQIALDIKVAFAEAFAPIFSAITRLNPSVETLTAGIRLLAAALAAVTAVAVINGIIKLREAFILLNATMLRNPFVAAGAALAAAAMYFGVLDDGSGVVNNLTDATDSNTEAANKNTQAKRNQEGLLVAQQKELDGIRKITEAFARQNEEIQRKINLDFDSLMMSDSQKKVAQQVAEIETNRVKSLLELQNQYNSLDAAGRERQAKAYQANRQAINENADAAKIAATEQIRNLDSVGSALKIYQSIQREAASSEEEMFKIAAKYKIDSSGLYERIDAESKLNEITKIRAVLMEQLNTVSEADKDKVIAAINEATTSVGLLDMSYQEAAASIMDVTTMTLKMNGATQETIDSIARVGRVSETIALGARGIGQANAEIASQSRTFGSGWSKAFRTYADDATNAAQTAERLFNKATQGMEDAIVNFAKTGKFEFKDLLNTITEELLRSQIRMLIANIFGGASGGGGGGGGLMGGLLGGIGKIFGFASGGVVGANSPILVGERGPEIFTPGSGGTITPNNQIGGSTNVVYNISAVDAASFKAMIARDPKFLYAVTEMGRRSVPAGA